MNINWSNVKDLTIDNKAVKKLELDGVTVWEKAKPKFYEYLENDGIAYIDTGIKNIVNCEFGIVVQQTELYNSGYPTILGAFDTNLKVIFGYDANSEYGFYSQPSSSYTRFFAEDLNKHTMIAKLYSESAEYIVDNTTYTGNYTITNGTTYSLTLFARNNSGSVTQHTKQRVYSLYIIDNGVLIRDFVPCEYKGEYGLWDLVNNEFYGNANSSGAFTVGSEIQYYDYLENDGIADINTGIYGSNNISTELKFRNIGSANRFICGGTGTYTPVIIQSNNMFNTRYTNVADSNVTTIVLTEVDQNDHIIKFNYNNSILWDGVEYASNLSLKTDNNPIELFGGANGTAYNATARIYYCKIYDNGTLVRDYKPCLYNGVAGLWDSVECKFYGNANNTGTLTVGSNG